MSGFKVIGGRFHNEPVLLKLVKSRGQRAERYRLVSELSCFPLDGDGSFRQADCLTADRKGFIDCVDITEDSAGVDGGTVIPRHQLDLVTA